VNNPCGLFVCDEGLDQVIEVPFNEGGACADPFFCLFDGVCEDRVCVGTIDRDSDNNPCTVEACDGSGGVALSDPEDFNACTIDTCAADGSPVNTPIDPADTNPCTVDACDPFSGVSHTPDDALCADADACNGEERCDAGLGCVAGTPPIVDDNDACTIDSCDATDGVSHVPVDVDDDVDCTVDTCDAATGTISNTPDNGRCPLNGVCDAIAGCGQFDALILTEVRFVGTSDDVFEVQNIGPRAIDLTRLTLQIGAATFSLTTRTATLAVGERASLSSTAPATFGLTGAADLGDVGGRVALLLDGTEVDVVDFASVVTSGTLAATDFVGSVALSTQLDPARATADGNDSPLAWCLSFRADNSLDLPNHGCRAATVINEVLYDPNGADDGNAFIELAAPGGADLGDLVVRGLNQNGTVQANTFRAFSLPIGTRAPIDGLLVLADALADGSTNVPNSDLRAANLDPENGPDSVELLDGATRLDLLGYGNVAGSLAIAEGTPTIDVASSFSLARDLLSTDTNDNAIDFDVDPTPSPGEQNAPTVVRITAVNPDDVMVLVPTRLTLTGENFTLNATVRVGDTAIPTASCTYTLPTTIACDFTPPTPGIFNVSVTATADRGGDVATLTAGLRVTFVTNDVDFCNIQFPTTPSLLTSGQSLFVFGRIFEPGITTEPGFSSRVVAEFGIADDAATPPDPTAGNAFSFAPALPNVANTGGFGNDDEYQFLFDRTAPGQYRYAFRFSLDGGLGFTYCDIGGSGDGFQPANAGLVTVVP